MNTPHDPFGFSRIPGYERPTAIEVPARVLPAARLNAIGSGIGVCFGVIFVAQVLLALVAGDMREYRARGIDKASGASGLMALAAGVVVWRKLR